VKVFDAGKTRMIGLPYGETRSSAIADKPRDARAMLVCKVVEVWQDFLLEYVDKKFTYIRWLIRHE